jgi:DUF971 family protein
MVAPTRIQLHKQSGLLELEFGEETSQLTAEFLRVHSPSAEVKGHGKGKEVLQYGKKNVRITGLQASGNYAILLIFDDGHDSGIYTWDYLAALCTNQQTLWDEYLLKLDNAGLSREAHTSAIRFIQPG